MVSLLLNRNFSPPTHSQCMVYKVGKMCWKTNWQINTSKTDQLSISTTQQFNNWTLKYQHNNSTSQLQICPTIHQPDTTVHGHHGRSRVMAENGPAQFGCYFATGDALPGMSGYGRQIFVSWMIITPCVDGWVRLVVLQPAHRARKRIIWKNLTDATQLLPPGSVRRHHSS